MILGWRGEDMGDVQTGIIGDMNLFFTCPWRRSFSYTESRAAAARNTEDLISSPGGQDATQTAHSPAPPSQPP